MNLRKIKGGDKSWMKRTNQLRRTTGKLACLSMGLEAIEVKLYTVLKRILMERWKLIYSARLVAKSARLVAFGNKQKHGVDHKKVYSFATCMPWI